MIIRSAVVSEYYLDHPQRIVEILRGTVVDSTFTRDMLLPLLACWAKSFDPYDERYNADDTVVNGREKKGQCEGGVEIMKYDRRDGSEYYDFHNPHKAATLFDIAVPNADEVMNKGIGHSEHMEGVDFPRLAY